MRALLAVLAGVAAVAGSARAEGADRGYVQGVFRPAVIAATGCRDALDPR